MRQRDLVLCVSLVLPGFVPLPGAAALPARAADPPACTRVLPGPDFPRPLPTGTTPADPAGFEDRGHGPDPPPVPAPRLDRRELEILAVHRVDLTGSGERVTILVEGEVFRFFGVAHFPRFLHRVDDPARGNVLWTQELPGGLLGAGRVADVDGDGREDLLFDRFRRVRLFRFGPAGFQLLWGDGDRPLIVGQRSRSRLGITGFGDVTGDGLRDALVEGPTFYPALSPREFDEGIRYTTIVEGVLVDEPSLELSVGDLDEDGLDDVLALTHYDFTYSIGLSRGDGTFDLAPLTPPDDADSVEGELHDLDADGHLDLVLTTYPVGGPTGVHVGWGRGDGTFEPYEFLSFGEPFRTVEFGDVDGDGQDDLVIGLAETPDPAGVSRLATFLARDRALVAAGRIELPTSVLALRTLRLGDLDGDGLADLVFARARSRERPRLGWRRSLGDGRFGPRRDLLAGPLPDTVSEIVVTDFDLDRVADLFVRVRRGFDVEDDNLALRGDGEGGFEITFHERAMVPHTRDRLIDVDLDGRPDLVSHGDYGDYQADDTYPLIIRRGDGLGGFGPPLPQRWMSFAGEPGRFRHAGTRDLARIGFFGETGTSIPIRGGFQLEVNPSLGFVLDRDTGPPEVELRALPLGDDLWRLATLPLDECSSSPRVTDRRVDLAALGQGWLLTYRSAPVAEVRVFEDPLTGRTGVRLLGPDRATALGAFRQALRTGGYPFRHMDPVRVAVSDEYGPPAEGVPGARRVQRIVLHEGVVREVEVTRPGGDVTFRLVAEDGVHAGVTTAGFRAAAGRAVPAAPGTPPLSPARNVVPGPADPPGALSVD